MKGIVWDEETLGVTFHEVTIPKETQERRWLSERNSSKSCRSSTTSSWSSTWKGEDRGGVDPRDHPKGAAIALKCVPVLCGVPSGTRAYSRFSTPSSATYPPPLRYRLWKVRPGHRRSEHREPKRRGFCALAFKVLMEEGRKFVYIRIYSGRISRRGRRLQREPG